MSEAVKVKKRREVIVDQQLEFEAAQLLLIALKPLNARARSRVIAFVTSQLEDINGPIAVPRAHFTGSPFRFLFGEPPPAPDTDDDENED
jgi:hypothetical protein